MATMIESCWEPEYWLRHCEGFRVCTHDGDVGYVDSVELMPSGDAAELVVRFGKRFTHEVVVPADAVEELDPVTERITIGPLLPSAPREEVGRQLHITVPA